MIIEFLGKTISVKEFACQIGTDPIDRILPHINLFVKVTKKCNARCRFCSDAATASSCSRFNIDKLFDIIQELQNLKIRINKVSITGGEPAVVKDLVYEILERMNIYPFTQIHTHLNSNGLLPSSQELMRHSRWDSISMSLHHYDINKLSEIYGCRIPNNVLSFDGINLQKLNASCNLIKGYIDSLDEIKKMLDLVIDIGIPRIGFVALMKINDFCRKHFIDIENIHIETIPHVHYIRSMSRGSDCKCSNYLYNKDLRVLEVYMRNYCNPNYCESSLVYDGEFLRQGFYEDNIIY